jgi:hypothetical protein
MSPTDVSGIAFAPAVRLSVTHSPESPKRTETGMGGVETLLPTLIVMLEGALANASLKPELGLCVHVNSWTAREEHREKMTDHQDDGTVSQRPWYQMCEFEGRIVCADVARPPSSGWGDACTPATRRAAIQANFTMVKGVARSCSHGLCPPFQRRADSPTKPEHV